MCQYRDLLIICQTWLKECRFIAATCETHLKGLVDVFGAVLVGLFCRKLCFLELQKLTPKDLKMNEIA